MKKRRILAVIFAVAITVGALGGCGEKQQGQEDSGELKEVTTGDTYPLETDVTLRYWMQMNANYSAVRNSMNDSKLKENLEKQTGVKLEFEHPVAGQEQEAFNILQSSGDAPDIIEWSWSSYPGGPDTAIEDGIIVPLNSYIDKVSPNLKKILEENPSWAQQLTTDSGYLYQYPFIRPSDVLSTYVTYMIRKDLLDKGGLEEPETLEEWDTVLHAFLDMGVETPLMMKYNNAQLELFSPFMSCFDIAGTFYHDENNTVKFGPYEENFRSWVAQMRKWYEEGILDKEFADVTVSRMDAVIANGKNGAYYDGVSSIARYKQSAADPSIQYIPLKVPTKTKGELAMYGQKDFPVLDCAAISMDSEHKEIAARFLDFGYSEAGHLIDIRIGGRGVLYVSGHGPGHAHPHLYPGAAGAGDKRRPDAVSIPDQLRARHLYRSVCAG